MHRRILAVLLTVCLLGFGTLAFVPHVHAEEMQQGVENLGIQPYTRGEVKISVGRGVDLPNMEIDTSESAIGNLTFRFRLTKEEWQNVFDSLPSFDSSAFIEVGFVPPEGAVSFFSVTTDAYPDPSLAAGIEEMPDEEWWPIDSGICGRPVQFGDVKQDGNKLYMRPYDDSYGIGVAWKDAEGNLIDLAPEEEKVCYMEYLNVFVRHEEQVLVPVQDEVSLPESFFELNPGNLPEEYFVSAPQYSGRRVMYFFDADAIQKRLDSGEKAADLIVQLRPRDGATIESVSGAGKLLPEGYVEFAFPLAENGVANSGTWTAEITVRWKRADGTKITSSLQIVQQFVTSKKWMDIYWQPAASERIVVKEDFTGKNGVKVEVPEDGHAHCTFPKNNAHNFEKVIIDSKGEAPLYLLPPEISGEEIVGYRMNQSAGAKIFYDPVLAKEQDGFVRNDPITYFADTGENGVSMKNAVTLVRTPILQGNKIRYNVYYPATYGDGPNRAAYLLVDWVNAEGETVSREYVYYTIEERTKPLGNMGVGKDKIGKKQVEEPTILVEDAQILYEVPMQEKTSGQANVGAQYILLDMADAQGNIVEPEEVVEVLLPYPEGMDYTDSANYTFTLQHYENEQDETGESVRVTPTENGLLFATKSFSPFLLIWGPEDEEIEPEAPQGDTDSAFVEPPYYPDYEDETQEPSSAEEATPGLRYVMCNRLNLRAGPGTDHASMGLLPRGTSMTVLSEENGWASVVLADGRQGFVSTAYLFGGTWPQEAVTIARNLNVRSGPGTEFDRIDLLPRGSAVTITGIESDFCEIAWENGKAYVSVHYLAFDNAL